LLIARIGVGGIVGAMFCALGACAFLPASGPASWDVVAGQQKAEGLPYGLVRVTPESVETLSHNSLRIAGSFTDRRQPKEVRFGVGDILGVTIFEAGSGGLFFPTDNGVRPGNFLSLPNQAVDSRGNISVPYAGQIPALGRSAPEVQRTIVEALKQRALEPQAVVTLVDQRASSISVLGDVRNAGRFPASASGERLLDTIARAGGLSGSGHDSWVVLERDGKRAMAPFGALIDEQKNNIFVRPNDTLYVFREPQTFLAFGASGRQGQIGFDAWRISLSEAVAKASGLNDSFADPAAIFLYRGESRKVAEKLGVDTSAFGGEIVPVIYNFNLRDPAGYFLASRFEMRNKDVIFVSNANSVETSKFLSYLRLIIATVNDPIIAANGAYALRSAINGAPVNTTIVTTSTVN
jgi:polysaccharide export outer membrane protein